MNRVRSFFVVFIALVAVSLPAQENPTPSVQKMTPENGAKSVPAGTSEFVVTFDQDMDPGGFSFVGGGPTFPKVMGKPFWRSAKECVLPISLEPGKEYTIRLNNERFQNFKSKAGVALKPVVVKFTTDTKTDPNAKPVTPTTRLKAAINQHYSYLDVRKVDWPAQWAIYEPKLDASKNPLDFAVLAGEMLAKTGDPHIWLTHDAETIPAFRRNVPPNADFKTLPKLVENWKQPNRYVATGTIGTDIGYLALLSFATLTNSDEMAPAFAAIEFFSEMKGLVIDVRFNAGGNELVAREIAGCFIDEPKLYAKHRTTRLSKRWLKPSEGRPKFHGKIAVLTGPYVLSSAEGFLLMMRQVEEAKLIGENSYGSSGNPKAHDLGNGVQIMLPSWQAMLPSGELFEGKGIKPDIEVKTKREDFSSDSDPVLAKAIEFLR
ncbi:MAG: S41 family peptidase [Verrucomicrobiales bacterium]